MSDRLNVAVLIQSYHPRIGGVESNLQALIAPLRERGVDVLVVTRRFADMAACVEVAGAPVYRVPESGGGFRASLISTASTLSWLVRHRGQLDVIHVHDLPSTTTTAILARLLLRRPLVAHVLRGGLLGDVAVLHRSRSGQLRVWLMRWLVEAFIVVNDETERLLHERGVPAERIAVVPYGVDTDHFRPAGRADRALLRTMLGLDGWRVVVLVARLEPEKGVERLLQAWARVKRAVPDALLLVVGNGSQRALLERRAAVVPDVRLLGNVVDPLPYLQAADCFTLPSYTEVLPNSLLEAMSAGLPCVATATSGSTQALDGGGLGDLVPPGDAIALADALVEALRLEAPERERRGDAARQHIVEYYALQTNADRLRDLYRRVGNRRPAR
jgi:glycosyltransferase involved in cell wall biosynthesis